MSWLSDAAVQRLVRAATWPDLAGTRYTIERELGRGGMGTVYLARDAELQRDVAIKVMSTAADHPGFAARLRTEAQVLAGLAHPGAVPVYDIGRLSDGRLYYAMQVVRGETLSAYVRHVRDRGERLRVFERVCESVAFAHAHGVVHRDLKPDNIMVGDFGAVHVMDWGVARVPGLAEPEDTVVGTPGFMAPEQAAAQADLVDTRSDVYSLGAILQFLLATDGQRIPKRLGAIASKALASDPGARYATAALLGADLASWRAGRAVMAYPESLLDRVGRFAATHQTAIILVVAYLLVRAILALAFRR